jgi:N6-adenosine-specific RNA methylase IME4
VGQLAGTSLDTGQELDALAKLPAAEQTKLMDAARAGRKVSARREAKAIRRRDRERELAEATEAASTITGSKLYGVIYADPPWRFEPYSRENGMDRAADNHYPTMSLDEIKALSVPAADDAVLFMWATVPMLVQALDVMAAWGFTYRSLFVWAKDKISTGYWTRNQNELLLIGTRGGVPAPAPGDQFSTQQTAPVGKHSAKPPVFAEIIEKMFPNLPKLEMFARGPARPGWNVWGNEAGESAA